MDFGIYVHIPYCIQRCFYCDFATYEKSQIPPPEKYVQRVCREIQNRSSHFSSRSIQTIYFGGGTPSLIEPELILSIIREIEKTGIHFSPDIEMTLEINPATISEKTLQHYLSMGFNRFSVGAQTFKGSLLKKLGREHNAEATRETLKLLSTNSLNYTFDLLFGLPGQSLEDLERDLNEVTSFSPSHMSAYCLTLPKHHFLNKDRPLEEVQIQMFQMIENSLSQQQLSQYEISNFSKKGSESKHNLLYWTDKEYWGVGLSSHSYLKKTESDPHWGVRFWNPRGLDEYFSQIDQEEKGSPLPYLTLPGEQKEFLRENQAMTDFCHTHLRLNRGLSKLSLERKFPCSQIAQNRLNKLESQGFLVFNHPYWSLTPKGRYLSNQIFEDLTFLPEDLTS